MPSIGGDVGFSPYSLVIPTSNVESTESIRNYGTAHHYLPINVRAIW